MLAIKANKNNETIYLIGLQDVDIEDLSKKDAVLSFRLGDCKVAMTKFSGSREEFLGHIKNLGGVLESPLIVKP